MSRTKTLSLSQRTREASEELRRYLVEHAADIDVCEALRDRAKVLEQDILTIVGDKKPEEFDGWTKSLVETTKVRIQVLNEIADLLER